MTSSDADAVDEQPAEAAVCGRVLKKTGQNPILHGGIRAPGQRRQAGVNVDLFPRVREMHQHQDPHVCK